MATHPIQYAAPVFRRLAGHPKVDLLVAYCSLQGATAGHDPDFGIRVQWDVPLLDGYPWKSLPNRAFRPGLDGFAGLINPGLVRLILSLRPDVVIVYGHRFVSQWFAIGTAKLAGIPLILCSDATSYRSVDQTVWKNRIKPLVIPRILRLSTVVCGPSASSLRFFENAGLPAGRIFLTPHAVSNEDFQRRAAASSVAETRRGWSLPEEAPVLLMVAKLQPRKRPQDALEAFAQAGVPGSYLVIAGEGPLRGELESRCRRLGLEDRVRFLGFVNQSELPAVYAAADLLLLSSEFEPWGLVVNEAMACNRSAVVSDRVGCHPELIEPGLTGFVYPCGRVDRLSEILRGHLSDRPRLHAMGKRAGERIGGWSIPHHVDCLVRAMEKAAAAKQ